MKLKIILPLLTLGLCSWSCANPGTTLEERAPLTASVFYGELDQLQEELQSLRAQYKGANFSADAVKILDSLAHNIQSEMKQARYDMARFGAKPDVQILHAVGNNTLSLYDDLNDLRNIAHRER